MIIKSEILENRIQSAKQIKRLAEKYYKDLGDKLNLNIYDFFSFVAKIPYKMDTKPIEILRRPKFTMQLNQADCKKKTLLCVAYFYANKIPYRLIGSSIKASKQIHHIFPQIYINGWKNFDATYPHNTIFKKKFVTNYEVMEV